MQKKIILLGSTGLIQRYIKKKIKIFKSLSIRNSKINSKINITNKCNILIILSHPGNIDFCQANKFLVQKFEKKIKKILKKVDKNILLIYISTDLLYVKNSLNLRHVKLKLNIEKFIKNHFVKHYILRVCKIYSYNLRDITEVSKIFFKIKNKINYKAFIDQYCHYIHIGEFIKILNKFIINKNKIKSGIYPVFKSNLFLSRYKFAKKIIKKFKLNEQYLIKSSLNNFKLKLPRIIRLKNKTLF